MKKTSTDAIEMFHDYDVHIPTRTLTLFGEIDTSAALAFVKNLHVLDAGSQEPVHILLNSFGGDDSQGQAIYDAIVSARSHCTITGVGEVQSAAAGIFQAADLRILRPHAEFMIHYGSRSLKATTTDFKNATRAMDRADVWYEEVLLERIREKHPQFTRTQLRRWLKQDTYLTHAEVLHWGLADQ